MSSIRPTEYNMTIRRNRTFSKEFNFVDSAGAAIDLSLYTITSEIRKEANYDSALIDTFNIDMTDAATGTIVLYFSEVETAAIAPTFGFYDILFDNGTDKETWVFGQVEVKESITNVS